MKIYVQNTGNRFMHYSKKIPFYLIFFLHYLHNHHRLQDFSPFGVLRHFIKNIKPYVM